MKRISLLTTLLFSLAMSLLFTSAHAQTADDCSNLMKYGIYDEHRIFTSEMHYKQIKEFFSSYQFSSRQQAEDKANELGLNLGDILNLDFSGKSSSRSYEQWEQAFLQSSYNEALSKGLKDERTKSISTAMTNLVGTCLTQRGLHVYLVPSNDNSNFAIKANFVPYTSRDPYQWTKITIRPHSVASTCDPQNKIGRNIKLGAEGAVFGCTRDPKETVQVLFNSYGGSEIITHEAYHPSKPTINFSASKSKITIGQGTTLNWSAANATKLVLHGVGEVDNPGSRNVSPRATTRYKLIASGEGGTTTKDTTISVAQRPPTLSGARVVFNTTSKNKDEDTQVDVNIICQGAIVAKKSGAYGEFKNNTSTGWIKMDVVDHPRKDHVIHACTVKLTEFPKGNDEWHFNWSLELSFSDGTRRLVDLGDGNVDHDRNIINKPI